MITLPEAFEQEMKQLLGEEEYEAYRKTFDEAVHRGLRVNNGKISTEEFLRRTDIPLKKVPWIPNGFYYPPGEEAILQAVESSANHSKAQ